MRVGIQTLEQLLLELQDQGVPGIGPLLRMARDQEARPLAWKRRRMRQKSRRPAKQRRERGRLLRHVRVRGPRSRLHIEQRLLRRHRTGRWRSALHPRSRAGD
jgi:hypothetical protein